MPIHEQKFATEKERDVFDIHTALIYLAFLKMTHKISLVSVDGVLECAICRTLATIAKPVLERVTVEIFDDKAEELRKLCPHLLEHDHSGDLKRVPAPNEKRN